MARSRKPSPSEAAGLTGRRRAASFAGHDGFACRAFDHAVAMGLERMADRARESLSTSRIGIGGAAGQSTSPGR
jgi:hypothetical protein